MSTSNRSKPKGTSDVLLTILTILTIQKSLGVCEFNTEVRSGIIALIN